MTQSASSLGKPRIDRRLDERENCLRGLSRWLESSRKRLGLGALALADRDGCLVAGAGSSQKCEELAAIAPLLADNHNGTGATVTPLAAGTAWLCAPAHECDSDAWTNVQQGCLRILGLRDAA